MIETADTISDDRDKGDVLDFLGPEAVVTLPHDLDKDQLLAFMVESMVRKRLLPSELQPSVTNGLTRRERTGTTGLGNGVALPHLRRPELTQFTGLIGVATEGVDFDSVDGQPARIVILVLSPTDQTERHLEILGRLARLFSDRTLKYSTQLSRSPESLLRFLGITSKA